VLVRARDVGRTVGAKFMLTRSAEAFAMMCVGHGHGGIDWGIDLLFWREIVISSLKSDRQTSDRTRQRCREATGRQARRLLRQTAWLHPRGQTSQQTDPSVHGPARCKMQSIDPARGAALFHR
jgi:uncharacterized membrane protein YhfC